MSALTTALSTSSCHPDNTPTRNSSCGSLCPRRPLGCRGRAFVMGPPALLKPGGGLVDTVMAMVARRLRARYDGQCTACGRVLPAGSLAAWDTDTRRLTCERCEPGQSSQPSTTAASKLKAGGSAQANYDRLPLVASSASVKPIPCWAGSSWRSPTSPSRPRPGPGRR
jgi:hypothetical protein